MLPLRLPNIITILNRRLIYPPNNNNKMQRSNRIGKHKTDHPTNNLCGSLIPIIKKVAQKQLPALTLQPSKTCLATMKKYLQIKNLRFAMIRCLESGQLYQLLKMRNPFEGKKHKSRKSIKNILHYSPKIVYALYHPNELHGHFWTWSQPRHRTLPRMKGFRGNVAQRSHQQAQQGKQEQEKEIPRFQNKQKDDVVQSSQGEELDLSGLIDPMRDVKKVVIANLEYVEQIYNVERYVEQREQRIIPQLPEQFHNISTSDKDQRWKNSIYMVSQKTVFPQKQYEMAFLSKQSLTFSDEL